ncbi:hypothetical protein [Actinomadura sp. DC4]|uniref:hypothetical protein n=1 Tax=Actinomadura sp. DC4 TaxID=3055069 RepID=UPI0025B018B4|nr:hypothetical protein [Actinomadura sp. DC4]MDN3355151.1 hypothetical protein [Actinomadura sp. DC4]
MPAGYTFDAVTTSSACATSGVGTQYHLRLPVDNLNACTRPAGFTYDDVTVTSACAKSGVATMFHLRAPADDINACTTSGVATMYLLVG